MRLFFRRGAILVDQLLDFVWIAQAADVDFDPGLPAAADSDPAGAQDPLCERLRQLNVANVAMPDFGDAARKPTLVQSCA